MFTKENASHVKIRLALKTVESEFLLRFVVTNALFCEMFSESKIAHSFSFSRTM